MRIPPKVLVIAGSDSSGGAGLEADQKVLAVHRCYAMTATTALTVQNTKGVQKVHITPPEIVGDQITAVADDIGVDVVKIGLYVIRERVVHKSIVAACGGTAVAILLEVVQLTKSDSDVPGMLASSETVEVVAKKLTEHKVNTIVLDPVMVSTSGSQLLHNDAVQSLREKLIPLATVLTPNIPESTLLLRDANIQYKDPTNLEELKDIAKLVHQLGCQAVLLKGGHIPLTENLTAATTDVEKECTVDILYDGTVSHVVQSRYSSSKNTHGTGCSLASAIAANLAHGEDLYQATKNACRYVGEGIKTSFDIGQGSGPINHFHSLQHLPFTAGNFIEYLLERSDVQPLWHRYTHHTFANKMADGTLPVDQFKDYLVQDYLYLTHFARTNALGAYKSRNMDDIVAGADIVLGIQREMNLHLEYCKEFGLHKEDIERQKESQACVAYSRYVLDIGQSEDWLALQMALMPCLLGYGATATRLQREKTSVKDGNKYWKWIENYVADDYQRAVQKGSALIEENMVKQSPTRIEELVSIFIRATEMEIQFWEPGTHTGS